MAAEKKNELTYEQAMDELEKIISDMESGRLPLEKSIEAFERGSALVKYCRGKLDVYTKKLDEITGAGSSGDAAGGAFADDEIDGDDEEDSENE